MNTETWKEVKGYEGLYEVSDLGRVRSLGRWCNSKNGSTQKKRNRILVQEITVHGYCRVRLYDKNGKSKHHVVHRLVLSAFVGDDDREVNHINEIKTDNRLINLEYCTSKENCNHGERNKKLSIANSKPVMQISKETGETIAIYDSQKEAADTLGICFRNISCVCRGKRKTAGGYIWRNINE